MHYHVQTPVSPPVSPCRECPYNLGHVHDVDAVELLTVPLHLLLLCFKRLVPRKIVTSPASV